jgi:hypothetical protein
MKCIKIIVPRLLIEHYLPHPEYSGEVLVVLENGLFTDVYIDGDFNLVTSTNDRELIRYLRKNKDLKPVSLNLKSQLWNLRSVEFSDQDTMFGWLNKKTNYSINEVGYTKGDIIEFIAHALTKNSQILIIENQHSKIGLVSYQIIYGEAAIYLEIYEKDLIKEDEVKMILEKVMGYIKDNYDIEIFSTTFFNEDSYTQKLYEDSGFYFENTFDIEVYYEQYKAQSLYRYDIFRNIITESDLNILDAFLELANDEIFEKPSYEEIKFLIIENMLPRIGIILENNYFNLNDSKEEKEDFHNKVEKLLTLINEKVFENNISEAATLKEFKNVLYQTLRIIDKYSIIKEKLIKKI